MKTENYDYWWDRTGGIDFLGNRSGRSEPFMYSWTVCEPNRALWTGNMNRLPNRTVTMMNLDDFGVHHFKDSSTNWFKCLFDRAISIAFQCLCDVCTSTKILVSVYSLWAIGHKRDWRLAEASLLSYVTSPKSVKPKVRVAACSSAHPLRDFIADPATCVQESINLRLRLPSQTYD